MTDEAQDVRGVVEVAAIESGFSGVVRIDRGGVTELATACGMADRAWVVPNTVETRLGIASGSKAFTALAAMSLVGDGVLDLSTTVRSLLGDDLPEIDERVTVEHLLAHRSGIGDYLDEDAQDDVNDYVLGVPVHELATTEQFLPLLRGHPMVFPPGTKFAYCNGGYVVLALLAERAAGRPFHDLVAERVLGPAGMVSTGYFRSDELPGGVALGYLTSSEPRTNVFHLPVRGSGDGGAFTTAEDVHRLWAALRDGRIVEAAVVEEMWRAHTPEAWSDYSYGLGFWLRVDRGTVMLEGMDAGVSFRTVHHRATGDTYTVLANTTEGAWPVLRAIAAALGF